MKDVLDAHSHTIVSGHAYNTMKEMSLAAAEKGLALLGITEHAPNMPGTCHEMYFLNFRVIDRHAYGLELLLGSELNIIDFSGTVDLSEKALSRLDYAIASLHDQCLAPGTIQENTAAVLGAIQNPYVNIIGHPDDGHFPLDYERIVSAAKDHHVLLELNNSSLHPNSHRFHARENLIVMLNLCKRYGAPIIVNSDAHAEFDVGNHRRAHALLEELSFPEALVVNTSVEKFKRYLKK